MQCKKKNPTLKKGTNLFLINIETHVGETNDRKQDSVCVPFYFKIKIKERFNQMAMCFHVFLQYNNGQGIQTYIKS